MTIRNEDVHQYNYMIEELSLQDNLEDWSKCSELSIVDKEYKKIIYKLAIKLWIKRKIGDGTLLLHPDIQEELIRRDFEPLSLHKKMIWASQLASYNGLDSREYFKRIKRKIIAKYGVVWWEDVYNRVKPAYATRQRLLKQIDNIGGATGYFASKSSFLGGVLMETRMDILKMIPKE